MTLPIGRAVQTRHGSKRLKPPICRSKRRCWRSRLLMSGWHGSSPRPKTSERIGAQLQCKEARRSTPRLRCAPARPLRTQLAETWCFPVIAMRSFGDPNHVRKRHIGKSFAKKEFPPSSGNRRCLHPFLQAARPLMLRLNELVYGQVLSPHRDTRPPFFARIG